MIEFKEAYKIVLKAAQKTDETEEIDMMDSLGRVLAEDVRSDVDMPPFDKTAVDGYACREEDIHETLKLIEVIPAGTVPKKEIGRGQCSKIMTGAKIPAGADCVIMVEDVEELDEGHIRYTQDRTNTNICFKAEDVQKNSLVLPAGKRIRPQDIAVLASVGCIRPLVFKKIKVAIASTGDELVEPSHVPDEGKIRNSNSYQLIAQTIRQNVIPVYQGIALDNESSLDELISKALKENDILLLSGGVSMGEFDLVPGLLKKNGVQILFKSIAVQPGRPTLFGKTSDGKYVFGLPGNPVSSFVQFELLVAPLIRAISGETSEKMNLRFRLAKNYERKKDKRDGWIPASMNEKGELVPSNYNGSAHIHALSYSDLIFKIPMGKKELKKGDFVDARLI